MQMNDENIQTEEVKRAAEPEYKIPEDATDNSRPNETAEVVRGNQQRRQTQNSCRVLTRNLTCCLQHKQRHRQQRRNNHEYTDCSKN